MISFLIIWLGYGLLGLGVTLWWDSKERKVTWQRVCGLAVAFVVLAPMLTSLALIAWMDEAVGKITKW